MRERNEKGKKVHHPISLKGNKENKIDFTRMTREGQNSFSLCEVEEEGYKEREESVKKRNGESNQHL